MRENKREREKERRMFDKAILVVQIIFTDEKASSFVAASKSGKWESKVV